MDLEQRIKAFSALGEQLRNNGLPEEYIIQAKNLNAWFTSDSIRFSVKSIGDWLTDENINQWVGSYHITQNTNPQNVGVVMAGNIPLVGFHDLLCVLLSGHKLYAKLSSDDRILPEKIIRLLWEIEPDFQKYIHVVERLKGMDAVIATGSDNTARYFEYYFRDIPHIIRKNRVSIAILDGSESKEELQEIGKDIFQYYGLGCRNISKIFVPEDFNINTFYEAIEPYSYVADHHKYYHNYEYNRAIYLLNQDVFWDNGFLLLKEEKGISSPVSVLFYEKYGKLSGVEKTISENKEKIQAVIGKGYIQFGCAQCPGINDYADNVDTMNFLLSI